MSHQLFSLLATPISTLRVSFSNQRDNRDKNGYASFAALLALLLGNLAAAPKEQKDDRAKYEIAGRNWTLANVRGSSSRTELFRSGCFERYWPRQKFAPKEAQTTKKRKRHRGVETSCGGDARVREYVSWGCLFPSSVDSNVASLLMLGLQAFLMSLFLREPVNLTDKQKYAL
ncbi:hypothetical protein K0M31_014689 [Melipona bicolor]|uniref:Uncharacterized protein n=1 Tax=Melipona bicolor TaxID=60889 RepID=A0AA40FH28_9HYME|nr:hypothetical protein K0M31_014689 [Melipona bicolor]